MWSKRKISFLLFPLFIFIILIGVLFVQKRFLSSPYTSLNTSTRAASQDSSFSSPYGFNLGGHFNKDKVDRRRIPPEEFANVSQLIAQSGAKWVRVGVFWRNLQPQRASDWKSSEWSYLTQLMTSLREQGLLIDLVIGEVPRWANGAPSEEKAGGYPPTKMEDWEQFIIKLVQKMGEAGIKIGAWEIENEIDGNGKIGYREHPEKYVEMFARAVPLIRSVPGIHEQGRAFIMPSSFFNVHFAKDDISYWLTHLNKDYIDALSFHTYGPDETQLLRYWNNFLTLRNDAGLRNKPVWLTETNLNEEPNNYLDPEAAVKMPQRIRTFQNSGAQKVFWYCEADGYWGASILKILDFSTRPRLEKHDDVYLAYQRLTGCLQVFSQESGQGKSGLNQTWQTASFTVPHDSFLNKISIKAGPYSTGNRTAICQVAGLSGNLSSPVSASFNQESWIDFSFEGQSVPLTKNTSYTVKCRNQDAWSSAYWILDWAKGKTLRVETCTSSIGFITTPTPAPVTGQCLSSCQTDADCRTGLVCAYRYSEDASLSGRRCRHAACQDRTDCVCPW